MASKCGENKNVVHDVLSTWSVTVQIHGNMESVCFIWWKRKVLLMVMSSVHLSPNRSWERTAQNACIIQLIILKPNMKILKLGYQFIFDVMFENCSSSSVWQLAKTTWIYKGFETRSCESQWSFFHLCCYSYQNS